MDKLKLICCVQDPYYRAENPKATVDNLVEWNDWPDISYADIYNYLILTPSLYTHEQLKAYKSLDGYNSYTNGWVSNVSVTVIQMAKARNYLVTACIKHSLSLSSPPVKAWPGCSETYWRSDLCSLHMYGCGGGACSHVAAILFVLEGNTQLKQQFSCTSLPCSWLPATVHNVSFSEMSKIDFTTPWQKRK